MKNTFKKKVIDTYLSLINSKYKLILIPCLAIIILLIVNLAIFIPSCMYTYYMILNTGSHDLLETGSLVMTDSDGNIYVSGYFAGMVDFDPGDGEDIRSSSGVLDIFLVKFDAIGNYEWVRTWGSQNVGLPEPGDFTADNSGNVYISGECTGTIEFNTAEGVEEFVCGEAYIPYLSKFSTNGEWLWTRHWDPCRVVDIAVDENGISIMGMQYQGSGNIVDYDPGLGESRLDCESDCSFLSAFDLDGNFLSVTSLPDTKQITNVSTDNSGCICTIDHPAWSNNIILTRWDTNRNQLWNIDLTDLDQLWHNRSTNLGIVMVNEIETDQSCNTYLAGRFFETASMYQVPTGHPGTSDSVEEIFFCKIDSYGNYVWGRTWTSSITDVVRSMAIDGTDFVYILGTFSDTTDFDPGIGVNEIRSNGSQDVFLCKYDAMGNYFWTKTWGDSGEDEGRGMSIDNQGNLLITGYFSGKVDLDPGSGIELRESKGPYEIYLLQLDSNGDLIWVKTWGSTERMTFRDED